ncbi:MAG TPA: HNH endonuclease [Marinobacter sp.]|uniref:HNH nuclease domain-containing protein n=1 Tax=marine sediment metagenome TaxID=412755 RepID=A0A0F9KTB1_9ZZZZ|nr:HNH endonuclease [Marinobacter sp.]
MAGKRKNRREFLESTIGRFWFSVDRKGSDECWIWHGIKALPNDYGFVYGRHSVYIGNGKSVSYRAHRFAWMLANGEIPAGMCILHKCDVPLCVNPRHLEIGTVRDNNRDAMRKGRVTHGEDVNTAKLTEDQVREIFCSPKGYSELGREYGVDPTNIMKIKRGESWKHLNLGTPA